MKSTVDSKGLGFVGQGSGFRIKGYGYRGQSSGFKGLGPRVQSSGCRV
jgi:hypothetical protein